MKRMTIGLMLSVGIFACSDNTPQPLLYTVKPKNFSIDVPAKGELFAAKATVISAPMSRNGAQVLSWLAPEFTYVEKGQVIAKFDGEVMSKSRQSKENDLNMTQQDIADKSSQLNKELNNINKDIQLVGEEKAFADKFAINDERILSRLEILESAQDSEYLASKRDYLQWKEGSFSNTAEGEMSLLEMKRKLHQDKLNILNESLERLEIKAPHEGMLVYASNWRGEKSRSGQSYWSGQKIAELPDITNMKAKVFVAENEAISLAEGQEVSFYLNALAEKSFTGKVESVAAFPSSIKRGDPQKFFEVIVTLDNQQADLFVPGRKLNAVIQVQKPQEKLVVPSQAVFAKNNQFYVYVFENGQFVKKTIEIGDSSLSHTVVLGGLEPGQQLALTEQGA